MTFWKLLFSHYRKKRVGNAQSSWTSKDSILNFCFAEQQSREWKTISSTFWHLDILGQPNIGSFCTQRTEEYLGCIVEKLSLFCIMSLKWSESFNTLTLDKKFKCALSIIQAQTSSTKGKKTSSSPNDFQKKKFKTWHLRFFSTGMLQYLFFCKIANNGACLFSWLMQ